jgi:predicted acetyltransferase
MPGTTVRPMAPDERPVVERLWQLYMHDLSEFRGTLPDETGLFPPGRLPRYLDEPDRCIHLVHADEAVAGFAMVRGLREPPLVVGEFFVLRAARRRGVGHQAAVQLLRMHRGTWEIAFQEQNLTAARFWRRVAADVAGPDWTEEPRPVPGKPEVPADTWLSLRT